MQITWLCSRYILTFHDPLLKFQLSFLLHSYYWFLTISCTIRTIEILKFSLPQTTDASHVNWKPLTCYLLTSRIPITLIKGSGIFYMLANIDTALDWLLNILHNARRCLEWICSAQEYPPSFFT